MLQNFMLQPVTYWIHGVIRFRFPYFALFASGFLLGYLTNNAVLLRSIEPSNPGLYLESKVTGNLGRKAGDFQTQDSLHDRIRILCMIMTMPKNYDKAKVVRNTWASHCNGHFFISSTVDASLPSIAGVTNEGRDSLWDKLKSALHHAAENYSEDFDYFFKADDDTFVIVENLRRLLADHSPNKPFLMGRRFKPFAKQGYLSGGGGYVISRGALFKLRDGLLHNPLCAGNKSGGAEDVRLGICAEAVGVPIIDSLDERGAERFHPLSPASMMDGTLSKKVSWIQRYNYHNNAMNVGCCSDRAISFHYVKPRDMYVFHYFLYQLRT